PVHRARGPSGTLCRGRKPGGFNTEDTHVADLERLENLLLLTLIAVVWCYRVGDYLDRQIKPIKIKKHGRRAKSVFKYVLDYISECLLSRVNKLKINIIQILSCT